MNARHCFPILLLTLLATNSSLLAHGLDKHYPHVGNIYFSGNYAESSFTFHGVGGWTASNPGLELDISIDENVFDSCTSWSNIPDFYDDCPTAGTAEPSGKTVFSIGSYDALKIQENTEYLARWWFSEGSVDVGEYAVVAQEVRHKWCWSDSPWCMGGTALASVLLDYIYSRSLTHQRHWFWTDSSLSAIGSSRVEPDGTYYQSTANGRHDGDLFGPNGADFDLFLYYWNSSTSTWDMVDSATSTNANEVIRYSGPPGFYFFEVYSYSGSGGYQLGISHP